MTKAPAQSYWRQLMHRWFVQYNPLYLVSAALVLVGVNLLSHALVQEGFLLGQLGVPAIADVYAWALIGGAALLTRIGLQRPAVMLALLAAFYQCDLTMTTETSVYLGWAGTMAVAVWWLSFVAKLVALSWAMRLQPSRTALLMPSAAALAMVVVPQLLPRLDAHARSILVGACVFAVLAAALWTSRSVRSLTDLDSWGKTVLRRSLRTTWLMWGTLFVLHVLFWCSELRVASGVLIPVALLLATRFARSELVVWVIVVGTLVLVGSWMPSLLSLTCLLAALVLALRALREPRRHTEPEAATANGPYRTSEGEPGGPSPAPATWSFGCATPAARTRLFTGVLTAAHLSAWTIGWSGGTWPAHDLALDLALSFAVIVLAWRLGVRWPLVAPSALVVHYGIAARIVGLPATMLGWSTLSMGVGFGLLIASLAVSYRLQRSGRARGWRDGAVADH